MRLGLCAALAALLFPAVTAAQTDAGWQLALRWPADGTVTSPYGQDGYRWHHAHLSRPLARVGDHVLQGERIGLAGCTGWCTGTHLHFELRYGNVAINPSFLMVG
jgi:murein DD-endopeptidase MepM/ murein hydrolase activator NlpD